SGLTAGVLDRPFLLGHLRFAQLGELGLELPGPLRLALSGPGPLLPDLQRLFALGAERLVVLILGDWRLSAGLIGGRVAGRVDGGVRVLGRIGHCGPPGRVEGWRCATPWLVAGEHGGLDAGAAEVAGVPQRGGTDSPVRPAGAERAR